MLGSTTDQLVPRYFPAFSHHEIITSLVSSCEQWKEKNGHANYRVGIVASAAYVPSFLTLFARLIHPEVTLA